MVARKGQVMVARKGQVNRHSILVYNKNSWRSGGPGLSVLAETLLQQLSTDELLSFQK